MFTSSDFQYAGIAIGLILLVYAVGVWRFPAANFVVGYTVAGLGSVPVYRQFSYAQLAVVIQAAAIAVLFLQAIPKFNRRDLGAVFTPRASILPLLLGTVWLKVAIDCGFNGMDEFRVSALKTAVFGLFLPLSILFLSLLRKPVEVVTRDLLIGMTLFPIAYVLPTLRPMMAEGRLAEAFFGISRLTMYGQDTINSGRMYFLGALGFIFMGVLPHVKARTRIVVTALSFVFLAMLILNGSRQYLIAMIVAYGVALLIMQRQSALRKLVTAASVTAVLALIAVQFRQTQTSFRVQGETIRHDGRIGIWMEKFGKLRESPILGIGFRNGGDIYVSYSSANEMYMDKDTVHGYLQDVFVEHGVVLGAAVLIGVGYFTRRVFSRALIRQRDARFILGGVVCTLIVPELFSSAVFNALGFHAAAVTSFFILRRGPVPPFPAGARPLPGMPPPGMPLPARGRIPGRRVEPPRPNQIG